MKYTPFKNTFWRWLADFWTLAAFLVVMEDFRRNGGISNIVGPVLAIYIAVLAIFSAEKEFERWHWFNRSRHIGEVYVVIWTLLIITLMVLIYLTGSSYKIPPEVFTTYIVVLGILAITRKSKQIFFEHNQGSKV